MGQLSLLRERGLWIVLALSPIVLMITIVTPLFVDNCVYQSIALDYIRFGRIPYITTWDSNFPGIILIHWLAIVLCGESDLGLRIFDAIVQLSFTIVLYSLLRRWFSMTATTISVLLYVAYYVSSGGTLYFQRDVFVMMAILTCLFVLPQEESRPLLARVRTVSAGAIAGFAVLIRPTSVLFAGLVGAYLIANQWRTASHRVALTRASLFFCGSILPCAATIGYYATLPTGLHALYDATIRFNLDEYVKYRQPWFFFWWEMAVKGCILPLFVLGMLAMRRSRGPSPLVRRFTSPQAWLYWGLVVCSIVIVILQHKFFRYHFGPFFMLLCPMAGVGIDALAGRFRTRTARVAAAAVCIYLCSFLTYSPAIVTSYVKSALCGESGLTASYDAHYNNSDYGGIRERQVLAYLAKPSNADGTVEICSFDPALRLHLKHKPAGPYVLPTPIAFGQDLGRSTTPTFTDYQYRWRAQYIDSLRAERPLFIILARNTIGLFLRDPYRAYLHGLPGFDSLLSSAYRYDTSFGTYQLFRYVGARTAERVGRGWQERGTSGASTAAAR